MKLVNGIAGTVLAFACSSTALTVSAQESGITDDTIKVGTSTSLTGPGAVISAVSKGIELKFKAVNAAGGVKMGDGKTRMIEFIIMDDAGEPPRTIANVRSMVERDQVFMLAGLVGTQQNQAIAPYLKERGVPSIFPYTGTYEFGDENKNPMSVPLVPSFTTEAAIYAEYLKANKPDAEVAASYFNTDFGQNFLDGFKKTIEGSNVSIVATQPHFVTDPTIDTQLTILKESNADILLVPTIPKYAAQTVRFAGESGWRPLTIVSYAASSLIALKPAGIENMQGVITGQFMKPIDSPEYANDAGVQQYRSDHAKIGADFQVGDNFGQLGYTMGAAVIAALENTKEPTRASVLKGARHLNNVELALLIPGITLTTNGAEDPWPIESMQPFVFEGEAYKPIGDLISYEGKTPKL